jgi:hypothetical protein
MATFLRLLEDKDKEPTLRELVGAFRRGDLNEKTFECSPELLREIPGAPFSYWVSDGVRAAFRKFPTFESTGRNGRQGLATADDFRFIRGWWEAGSGGAKWLPFAKGGAYSPIYGDIYLVVNWADDGAELKAFAGSVIRNPDFYFRPGLTWSLRTKSRLSMRALPLGCVFSHKGPGVFCEGDDAHSLLAVLGVCSTPHFYSLVEVQLAAADAQLGGAAHSFEVGVIQKTPMPELNGESVAELSRRVRRIWNLDKLLRSSVEASRHFLLPDALLTGRGLLDQARIRSEVSTLQREIERIGASLYGFDPMSPTASVESQELVSATSDDAEEEVEDDTEFLDESIALKSWCVGVAFGRFAVDPLSTDRGKHALQESNPFESLPSICPGMVESGEGVVRRPYDVLVEDPGHPQDLVRLIEEVLLRVKAAVPDDIRSWLQRDFFGSHLQRYSKSRRKAPIYWPLPTASGRYTLWIYYPGLSSQTLYTVINDFVEPKHQQVGAEMTGLRNKGSARSREEEKQFEALQSFEVELIELRDTLLKLAPTYKPNHDDGVQISAAPLWPLFRHKPWQKVLKDTWAKLEEGDYDWAQLAMNYWPERVREKCKTDKSLAIAHGMEDLYVEPETKPKKARGKMKVGADE